MRKLFCIITTGFLLLHTNKIYAQDIRFNRVLDNAGNSWRGITDIAQDRQGFIWFTTIDKGLQFFDGVKTRSYTNDSRNPNSLANNILLCMAMDSSDIIWLGTGFFGLDKFDISANKFTHFKHIPNDPNSLISDTITALLKDRSGNLWVGTNMGLDMLDKKTGKFIHYRNDSNDSSSLSDKGISVIYEDKQNTLWVGCGTFFSIGSIQSSIGGLNRFNKKTGKFTHYLYNPANPNSLAGNMVFSMYEDSKGNFWIGATADALQTLDRSTGIFKRYYYDPAHAEKITRVPFDKKRSAPITIITEDAAGMLWIGSLASGLNRYDPVTKKITHHGFITDGNKLISTKDTTTGFNDALAYRALSSKDGLFWIGTLKGNLFNLNLFKTTIPYFTIKQQESNSLYCEPNGKLLWIATDDGLLRRDLNTQAEKLWVNDPKDDNSLSQNTIYAMKGDDEGKIWLGTVGGGLDKFDPVTGKFTHHKYNSQKPGSIGSNQINNLFIDHDKNVWAATDSGICKLDRSTGSFTNYKHIDKDSASIISNNLFCIAEDNDHSIWAGTDLGLSKLDNRTGKFSHYLNNSGIRCICVDSKGIIWAGGVEALFYYDKAKDQFIVYADQNSAVAVNSLLAITEDNSKDLWISTSSSIIKINADRTEMKKYTEAHGVRYNQMGWSDNFKAKDGRLFLGHWNGYYSFYPDKIKDHSVPPLLTVSAFRIGDKEIKAEPGGILNEHISETKEIKLNHSQNVFSFDFFVLDYITPGDEKYQFMLENYDNTWHEIGSDRRAFFFNVPPGNYIFHVKAINSDGTQAEKTIRIIITPPWWKTWWAYCMYGLLLAGLGFLIYKLQKRRIVFAERRRTQEKELAQAKEIEKAYTELKTTQSQLIQSEKMASLGELTAGIAHEIQNPLNFVNNFSEVNTELLTEMKEEIDKGNIDDAKAIANNAIENQKKINHHGKRADAIVKGMLQHSRSSNNIKEPTNINALAEEYLRLSYHGLRAKDKSFNATMKTDFDESMGNINIIPQDIGRVILNLINNAFYVVDEKKKQNQNGYEPSVSVSTKRNNGKAEIKVSDNGNGIPQKVLDKIFQPFFTTKPTGQGTGLGLSLSYDIVKAHGGELRVETREGEGTEFIVILPA